MEKIMLPVLLSLLSFGCGQERASVQNPVQLTYGTSTQSNANMNYQPSVIIGGQPLGKENFLATLLMDVQDQGVHLSVLEETIKQELALPEGKHLIDFPPPLNTSPFAAMRVAYPKEFLELNETTRTGFMTFYRQLDKINNTLAKRNVLIPSALSNAGEHVRIYNRIILEDITIARKAAKTLKHE